MEDRNVADPNEMVVQMMVLADSEMSAAIIPLPLGQMSLPEAVEYLDALTLQCCGRLQVLQQSLLKQPPLRTILPISNSQTWIIHLHSKMSGISIVLTQYV